MRKKQSRKFIITLVLLVLAGIGWFNWQAMEEKAITEKYNLPLSVLDKAYVGCELHWKKNGVRKACSQSVVDGILKSSDPAVQVTVITGRKTKFSMRAQHAASDKIFQVDKEGDIYLNVNGCLAKVRFYTLTPKDMQVLESQCKL